MGKPARTISILVSLAVLFYFLLGCSWGQTTSPLGSGSWTPSPPPETSSALWVLNWTAGLSIIGGMVSMVMGEPMGMRAIVGGVVLVILSYVISVYAALVLIPVGIVLTVISASWGYLTIARAWRTR